MTIFARAFAKNLLCQSVAAAALLSAMPAHASALDAADGDVGYDDQTIIVTGTVDGYRTVETTTGTKTKTAILDVPQSIGVVTEDQIDDQAIRSVTDLVRLIPGVSAGQGEGHRDQITLRGNNSTADFFVDGLRDDVQYYRGFYNLDRIEVHKGPNAMIFGRGGGGGLVNRITKGALLGDNRVSATASVDTFGAWYGAIDANAALGDGAALRLNGFYEELNNHRDDYDGHRYAVNPVFGAQLGDAVKLQLGYEYSRDDRAVDRGLPSAFAGTIDTPAGPLRGYRDTSFGRRDTNRSQFEGHALRFRGEAALTDALTFSVQTQYGDYDKGYTNIYAASPVSAATPATVAVEAYRDLTQRQSFIGQSNLEWRGSTGRVDHVLLIGAEYTDQDTQSERINGFFGTLNDAASRRRTVVLTQDPEIPAVRFVSGPTGNGNRAAQGRLSQTSFYVQDQIGIGDHVDIIAGVRYDRFKLAVTNVFSGDEFARTDDLWSPRVGVVVKPVPNASVYVSYSKSFLPQSGDQFASLDLTSETLKPETFDNYEIGAKWDITPALTASAAVYRLDRGNTRAPGPVAGTVVQTGSQRSSGFEIALTGKITPEWQIAAGYGYTRARITQTTSAAPVGRTVAQVPEHQLTLWSRYDLSDRFGFGAGLYHQSSQFATISNAVRLPGYTRADAALYFTLTEGIEAQINVENLTGTRYFPVAHNDNNISTGAPRNARFTVKASF